MRSPGEAREATATIAAKIANLRSLRLAKEHADKQTAGATGIIKRHKVDPLSR